MNPLISLQNLSIATHDFRTKVEECVDQIKDYYNAVDDIIMACDKVLATPHKESAFVWREAVQELCNSIINHELG